MNRRLLLLTVFFIGIFTTVACSDATQSTSPATEKQSVTTDSFVDGNGWTWHKVDEIDSYSESTPDDIETVEGLEKLPSIEDMTVEEVADTFKPIMEFNQKVYELSDEDTTELAEEMKNAEEAGVSRSDPAMALDGTSSQFGSTSGSTNQTTTPLSPTGSGGVSTNDTFGGEERTAAPSDTWPDRMIAEAGCTAFKLIGHHMAATAAHCVYDDGLDSDGPRNWKSPSPWHFSADDTIPGIDPVDTGCVARVVPRLYKEWKHHPALDMAAILFQSPLGSCDFSNYNVGYFGYDEMGPANGKRTHQIGGYPYPPPYNTQHPDYYEDEDDAWVRRLYPRRLVYTIDASGGNSGSPVAKQNPTWNGYEFVYATSVHSGGYRFPFVRRNNGVRFSGGVLHWLKVMKNITSLPQ